MSRRKISERNIRQLTKTGGGKSISITLPIELVRQLKWRTRQKVTVKKIGKKIVIEDWNK